MRAFAIAALLIAAPALAGRPGVNVQVDAPEPVQTVVQQIPAQPTVQTVTIDCPKTVYEDEVRTRIVTKMVPQEVEEQYTVRVPKPVMVPRTFQIQCPPEPAADVQVASTPPCNCTAVQVNACDCNGRTDVSVQGLGADVQVSGPGPGLDPEPRGCLARLLRRIRDRRAGGGLFGRQSGISVNVR